MSDPEKPRDELEGTEAPFVSHLVELRDRLIRALIAVGVAFGVLALWPGPGPLYDMLAAPLVANLPQGSTPAPNYKHPKKRWRLKRGATPQWYKQRQGIRTRAQSGAARVARFRPPGTTHK